MSLFDACFSSKSVSTKEHHKIHCKKNSVTLFRGCRFSILVVGEKLFWKEKKKTETFFWRRNYLNKISSKKKNPLFL